MKIWCSECHREMDFHELLGYGEAYLLKVTTSAVSNLLLEALKLYCFESTKKGFVDGSMAGIANVFKIECSRCKKVVDWVVHNNLEDAYKKERSVLL